MLTLRVLSCIKVYDKINFIKSNFIRIVACSFLNHDCDRTVTQNNNLHSAFILYAIESYISQLRITSNHYCDEFYCLGPAGRPWHRPLFEPNNGGVGWSPRGRFPICRDLRQVVIICVAQSWIVVLCVGYIRDTVKNTKTSLFLRGVLTTSHEDSVFIITVIIFFCSVSLSSFGRHTVLYNITNIIYITSHGMSLCL